MRTVFMGRGNQSVKHMCVSGDRDFQFNFHILLSYAIFSLTRSNKNLKS